jgi:hypothetical protein
LFSGNYCSSFIGTDLSSTFCPRGTFDGFGFFPGHYFFSMLWSAEMANYPDYVTIIPAVNQTNYWYNIEVDEIAKQGIATISNKTYTGTLYEYSGGMGPWSGKLLGMLWINLLIRLFSLACLAFMASSTNRWVSDKIARCSHCIFSCCGVCHLKEYSVPRDELNPPFRTTPRRTNSNLSSQSQNVTRVLPIFGPASERVHRSPSDLLAESHSSK